MSLNNLLFRRGANTPDTDQARELRRLRAEQRAIDGSMAVIHFDRDARVLDANANFLRAMGYRQLDEIRGEHHRLFCDADYASSAEYRRFWAELQEGKAFQGRVRRQDARGRPVWLEATYAPILGEEEEIQGFVKIASDITRQVEQSQRDEATLGALNRVMAVVEFTVDGIVTRANDNFLRVMGYEHQPVVGLHHREFCDPSFTRSPDYAALWRQLAEGRYFADRIRRRARDGSVRWLQASYNPVLDEEGRVCAVIKFATDITEQVLHQQAEREGADHALNASRETQEQCRTGMGTIERNLDEIRGMAERIEQANRDVSSLSARSEDITTVVGTIRAVAAQTNLLALNAAIEAARAGEQGRGFAVVADEVRELAARTADSTTEVSEMVEQIQLETRKAVAAMEALLEGVQSSVSLTEQSGQTMRTINEHADSVVEAIGRFSDMKA